MRNRTFLYRLFLPAIVLLFAGAVPAVVSAASLRSKPDAWPVRHFQSEAAGIQIPFVYVNGHIFVDVSVNGKPGYVFLVDSGTSVDILDLQVSEDLGIPIEKIRRAKDLGLGRGKVKMAGARHLDLETRDVRMQAVPVGNSAEIVDLQGLAEAMNHPIDGILGYPLLRRFVVGFNFETDEMTLWPEHGFRYQGNGNVMQLVEHRDNVPAIEVTMNTLTSKTRSAKVEIDTGSDATLLLFPKYARQAHIDDAFFTTNTKMKPGQGYGLGGDFPILPAEFASMKMGRVLVTHFLAFMMQTSPAVARRKISGVIGTTVLRNYRWVIFDVRRGQVIFELPPPPPLVQTAALGH